MEKEPSILVTICARARSSRLPGKNTMMLHGKPLYQWTFDVASELNYSVVVSTDDKRILLVAENLPYAFQTIRRPDHLDDVGKMAQIRDALIIMEHKLNKQFDLIVDLDVTNPMRTIKDVEACIFKAKKSGWKVVLSVTPARRNPYFNQVPTQVPDNGKQPIHLQDAPEVYDLNCNIYVYRRDFLLSGATSPIVENRGIYLMPDYTAFDIDTELDFRVVEFLMKECGYVETA